MDKSLIKKTYMIVVILFITVLSGLFITKNFRKLERYFKIKKAVSQKPHAVNLVLSEKKKILYQKSFPFNRSGNYYIINNFNLLNYIKNDSISFFVNKRETKTYKLYRFKDFNIIHFRKYYFIFLDPNQGIESFLKLKNSILKIIESLSEKKDN